MKVKKGSVIVYKLPGRASGVAVVETTHFQGPTKTMHFLDIRDVNTGKRLQIARTQIISSRKEADES